MNVINPAASRKGNQLAFQQLAYQNDIWRVDLAGKTLRQGAPRMIISAKGSNFRPQYSPDGKKIAFESSRSGYSEIWVCNSDASDCNAVTNLKGVAGAPRWSPDGKTLAFEYRPQAYSEIYVAELAGGAPRRVATFSHADNGGLVWSRDGKWIYFYSDPEGGRFQICRLGHVQDVP